MIEKLNFIKGSIVYEVDKNGLENGWEFDLPKEQIYLLAIFSLIIGETSLK